MSPLVVAAVVPLAAVLTGAVAVLARGLREQAGWSARIGEHLAATGDYPTVAQLRSGRIGWTAPEAAEPEPVASPGGAR